MTLVGADRVATQEQRVIDAALRCIARWGIGKTTLDDVAREASCSRATIYRLFPGGKDAVFEALVDAELGRFFDGLVEHLDAPGALDHRDGEFPSLDIGLGEMLRAPSQRAFGDRPCGIGAARDRARVEAERAMLEHGLDDHSQTRFEIRAVLRPLRGRP